MSDYYVFTNGEREIARKRANDLRNPNAYANALERKHKCQILVFHVVGNIKVKIERW